MDCVDKFSQLGADCRWARLEGHSPAAIQHAIGKGVPEWVTVSEAARLCFPRPVSFRQRGASSLRLPVLLFD